MELFRAEYELNKPKNWGAKTFKRLQEREIEKLLPPKELTTNLKTVLSETKVTNTEIDVTQLLTTLSDEEMCEYFNHIPICNTLIMQRWKQCSDQVLRCITWIFLILL